MKHYIIDGNNLLGKDRLLNHLQKKDQQQSREKLSFLLSRYFVKKKATISLHFDGYEREVIKVSFLKIIYSDNLSADDKIKREIEKSRNPRNIVLVTSDSNLMEFGRVCSCTIIKSEEFMQHLKPSTDTDDDKLESDSNKNIEEYKKLFGIDSADK